jgi:tetratricopeptide (TPR) repeat protein
VIRSPELVFSQKSKNPSQPLVKSASTTEESTLAVLCGRIIEAAWLLAVLVVPVLCDPHGLHGFDPIKMAALRTLGLLTAGVLLLRALCGGFPQVREAFRGSRLWLPAAVSMLVVTLVSTRFSLEPGDSFWGSSAYQEGAFTLACLLGLFTGVATHFRTREQAHRLVVVALLSSLPVCLYALIQRLGLDPRFSNDLRDAATSFAGHPLYLAGYLLMLMPLGVWKLWGSMREGKSKAVAAAFYAALLLLQVFALTSTEKRGPQIAVLAMVVCMLVLLAACRRRFRLAGWGLALAAAGGLSLTALALANKAGLPLPQVPLVGRLAYVIPMGKGTGDDFRDSLWSKAPAIVTPAKPFPFPDGTSDLAPAVRSAIGYGPETLASVLAHFWLYLPAGPSLITESRFHNMFWETWQSVGWIGLIAMFWFYACVFAGGARALGLPFEIRPGQSLAAAAAAGAALAAILTVLYGPGYIGLGFLAGFAAGLPLWVLAGAFRHRGSAVEPVESPDQLLTLALLGAFLGHQVDMAFVFTTANTTVLFWILSGALIGWGFRATEAEEVAVVREPPRSWIPAGLWGGALAGMLLITLLHVFLDYRSLQPSSFFQVLQATLLQIRFDHGPSHLLALMFLPTWIAGSWLLPSVFSGANTESLRKARLLAAGSSLALAVTFAVSKAAWIAALGPIPDASAPVAAVLAQAAGYGFTSILLLGMIALATVIAATLLADLHGCRRTPALNWGIAAILTGCVGALCWQAAWRAPRHEAYTRWASVLDAQNRKTLAAAVYRKALELEPMNVTDRIFVMKELSERAEQETGTPAYSTFMAEAEAVMLPLRRGHELNVGNYCLGHLYMTWALAETDKALKTRLALRAKDALDRSTKFMPQAEPSWFCASLTDRLLLGDIASADREATIANRLTRQVPATPWGDFYANQSLMAREVRAKKLFADRAIHFFDQALVQGEKLKLKRRTNSVEREILNEDTYRTLITKGLMQNILGQREGALACFTAATRQGCTDGEWEAEALIARSLADLGRRADALRHLDLALANAPAPRRQELEKLKVSLGEKNENL